MSLKIPIKNILKLLIVFSIFMFILTAYQNSISSIKVYADPTGNGNQGDGKHKAKKPHCANTLTFFFYSLLQPKNQYSYF
jgi:hypothetical protein